MLSCVAEPEVEFDNPCDPANGIRNVATGEVAGCGPCRVWCSKVVPSCCERCGSGSDWSDDCGDLDGCILECDDALNPNGSRPGQVNAERLRLEEKILAHRVTGCCKFGRDGCDDAGYTLWLDGGYCAPP